MGEGGVAFEDGEVEGGGRGGRVGWGGDGEGTHWNDGDRGLDVEGMLEWVVGRFERSRR